ncbi:MAG: DsrE/DsrF/DrsH-like family protein [Thermoleophilia bacterium]|nr:DsrE/DsrF/DrsH-like family protein [Thermoleophilia bacterium]
MADKTAALEQRIEALERRLPEDRLTLGVISGDLDKVMAAFIIALGATAYDTEVDMFFTFWATAALRDPAKRVKKEPIDRMFGMMLPTGTGRLPLSKMQVMGLGPVMMKRVMKTHGVASLEDLMHTAAQAGVRIHVCTMTMDVMGLQQEELIDYPHLDYVGVGHLVDLMQRSRNSFFI